MAEFQSLKAEVPTWDLDTDEKLHSKLDNFLNHILSQCEVIHKNAETTEYETNAVSVYLGDTLNALSNLSNKKFIENSMAPLEETQLPIKEIKKPSEVSVEQKQANYTKAVQAAIGALGITSNEDDELLTKSHTMSMAMFRSPDHLPYLLGSKAFASDEYFGIIDKVEDQSKYVRQLDREALDNSPTSKIQASPSSGSSSGDVHYSVNGSCLTVAAPATGAVELRDNTLQPPAPLSELLKQSEDRNGAPPVNPNGGGGRANIMAEITGRGAMMAEITGRNAMLAEITGRGDTGRGAMLAEIQARGKIEESNDRSTMLSEIENRGRVQTDVPTGNARTNMLNEIIARGQGGMQSKTAEDANDRVSAIKSNPMYQPVAQQPARGARLFDEDDPDVEVGNSDMFQSKGNNKKRFENLLGAPTNPILGGGNPGFNPLAANPFDPFGMSNPFLPFNAKQEPAAIIPTPKEESKQAAPAETSQKKLKSLLEDSDDEDASLNRQRLLTQKYGMESSTMDFQPKPAQKTSKLFDDGEDDFMAMRKSTAPVKKEVPKVAEKKKALFDEAEDDDDFMKKKPQPPAVQETKKKAIEEDDDDLLISSSRRSQTIAGGKKGGKPTLFDDDDDDLPIPSKNTMAASKAKPIVGKKKGLFDEEEEEEKVPEIKKTQPVVNKPAVIPAKKTLFEEEEEEETPKAKAPVVIKKEEPKEEIKPVVIEKKEEPKPVVVEQKEEPKPVVPVVEEKPVVVEEPAAGRPSVKNNMTQMIKAAHLNRKKRGGSSEEDSDSDEDTTPVRKPAPQTAVIEKPVEEVQEQAKQEISQPEVVKQEEAPAQVEPEPVKEPEPEVKAEPEQPRASVKGISSKISALQATLNINMASLGPVDGLPGHMRKPKPSIQREEEPSQNLAPGELSHSAALSKPKQQTKAKKTIMFDDDDDEEPAPPVKNFGFVTKEVKQEVPPVQQYEEPVVQVEQRTSTMPKKVEPVEDFEPVKSQPVVTESYGSDNPLALLSGLKAIDEQPKSKKGSPVRESITREEETKKSNDNPLALLNNLKDLDNGRKSNKPKGKKKGGLFEDDEEEEDGGFLPSPSKPVVESRQSAVPAKKKNLFEDSDEDETPIGRKSAAPARPTQTRKNIFDDDD